MTETDNKYTNGKIYALRSHNSENYYIGSTITRLSQRLHEHKKKYNQYNDKKTYSKYQSSYKIMELGDYFIELLENYPCNSKEELNKKEGEYIRKYKTEIVNKCIAGRKNSEYVKDNHIHLNKLSKIRRDKIKDVINEKSKIKVMCECGQYLRKDSLRKHNKTKKHIDKLEEKSK